MGKDLEEKTEDSSFNKTMVGMIIITGSILLSTTNTGSYFFINNQISKAEKAGEKYARSYCERLLEDNNNALLFSGGNKAATNYLFGKNN